MDCQYCRNIHNVRVQQQAEIPQNGKDFWIDALCEYNLNITTV